MEGFEASELLRVTEKDPATRRGQAGTPSPQEVRQFDEDAYQVGFPRSGTRSDGEPQATSRSAAPSRVSRTRTSAPALIEIPRLD